MDNTNIKIKVVSLDGHTDLELPAMDAVREINRLVKEEGKWAFLDGIFTDPQELTAEGLTQIQDITLTNALAGG